MLWCFWAFKHISWANGVTFICAFNVALLFILGAILGFLSGLMNNTYTM